MRKRHISKLAFCAVFLFVLYGGVVSSADNAIFAPFVSHLKAEVTGNSVILNWQDSPSAPGAVYIYRATRAFLNPSLPEYVQSVPYGQQYYTEYVPSFGTWYYMVVASDENGHRYEMVVPYNNLVIFAADGSSDKKIIQAAGSIPAAEPMMAPITVPVRPLPAMTVPMATAPVITLTALNAAAEDNGIKVSFVSTNPLKRAVLYRHTAPIMTLSDLLHADIAQLPGAVSPFIDAVKYNTNYYYAVIYDEDLRTGEAFISPGHNATIYPASIAPPPAISAPPPAPARLSLEAAAAISDTNWMSPIPWQQQQSPPLITQQPASVPQRQFSPEPHVFNQDLTQTIPGTDEYLLHIIVKESFTWRNWAKTAADLHQLLRTVHNQAVESRARFYLGQVYYFTGLYTNAMTEFLAIQSRYPEETAVWIQLLLSAQPGT